MRVLIKNYDSQKNCYKRYKNVYRDLTLNELNGILNKIPPYDSEKDKNIIYVATKEFVFEKTLAEGYYVTPNYNLLGYLKVSIELKNLDNLFNNKKFRKQIFEKRTYGDVILGQILSTLLFCTLPFFNTLTLFLNFQYLFTNLLSLSLFLIILSISTIIYFIIDAVLYIKRPIIDLRYKIEYFNELEIVNLTGLIVMVSQLIYPIIFQIYSFKLFTFEDILYSDIFLIMIFIYITLIFRDVRRIVHAYRIKNNLLEALLERISKSNIKLKNYYLILYFYIENRRIFKTGIISPLITASLPIIALFPYISLF